METKLLTPICMICKKERHIEITEEQYQKMMDGQEHIQDILPEHSIDDREILISGICGDCFDEAVKE